MQLERLVARTRTRLARGAFAGLLRSAQVGATVARKDCATTDTPRGSGSWANDWSQQTGPLDARKPEAGTWSADRTEAAEGGSAMERAMSLALPGRDRPGTPPPCATPKSPPAPLAAGAGPHARIRTRPLMSLQDVRLHNWLIDRLEAEAPTCSLHARVAFSAFLAADPAEGSADPLRGLVADMLIADRTGQPVAALLRTGTAFDPRPPGLVAALREADLPVIDLPPRPGLADLWAEIARVLPAD